jgi:hypothetical protein
MSLLRHKVVAIGFVCFCLAGVLYVASDSYGFFSFARSAKLIADQKTLLDAYEAKRGIEQDLSADRLSLADAVTRCRDVDAGRPSDLPFRFSEDWGNSVEEGYANYVINGVVGMLHEQPGEQAVIARLSAERQEYLGRGQAASGN